MDLSLLQILSQISEEEQIILEDKKLNKSLYTDEKGFTVDKEKLLERGKLISLRSHTRFIDFPKHCHNYIEIMYMAQGSTTHIINDDKTVRLEQGELLFFNRHAFHEIKKAGLDDIAVNFIVLPQFFDIAYEMTEDSNILRQFVAENLRSDNSKLSYLHFKASSILPVQNIVETLIWNIVNKTPNRNKINQVTMGLLFLHLLNHTDRIDLPDTTDYNNILIIRVLREIEENYQTVSLTMLARELNQSVVQLSKLIKQITGKTFIQLLQEKRFSKALQLLLTTRLSVSDIAAYVGYENVSYFYRRFSEIYNMRPAKYREMHKSN